ncbi:hypothetical protein [Acidovorax sp. FG27]|uniref:hypothetical protein n=1 Tax=Acidovorax sp. FG27 TaxID=3133652 RepID=UPI00334055CB
MIAPLFKKNTLEQTSFQVDEAGFNFRGRKYAFADVVETRSSRVIHQTRHISVGVTESHDPAMSFLLVMRDGEHIQVTEQSTLTSSTKHARVDQLQQAFDAICAKTFDQRVKNMSVKLMLAASSPMAVGGSRLSSRSSSMRVQVLPIP